MLLLKGCQRCRGDLFVETLVGVTDMVCLQCGYRRTVGPKIPARLAGARR